MKARFIFLTFLLLFARGCDIYSTQLWFFQAGGYADETNPLVSLLGFRWTGLMLVNGLIVGLVIFAFYYYSFRYKRPQLTRVPEKLTDFVSELYFREQGHFLKIFYRFPKDRKMVLAHMGYVLVRVLAIASLLAAIHNVGQYYQVPAYQTFREMVGRPLYVIYALILGSFAYFQIRLWYREFEWAKAESLPPVG